ncbi:MAG: hypothetical protein ACI8T1_004415 [Verrucomicrobiales bacterium]|jgi:hypothetical protein
MSLASDESMQTINQPVRRVSTLTSILSTLMNEQSEVPHVSIYQAAGRLPADAEQARIQLKTNLQTARNLLLGDGVNEEEVDALLKEALSLTSQSGKDDFWNHQEGGLALFITADGIKKLSVGRAFDNLVVASCEYHLKPLMALAANVDAYHFLSLSQNDVKFLRGSALGIREVEVPNLPSSYKDAMATLGYPPDSFAASAAESHLKVDHKHLKMYFKTINAAVFAFIKGSEWPLLVAGDSAYEPIYREANQFAHLSEAFLEGNPEHLEFDDLHSKASALLKSDFVESQKRTLINLAKEEPPETIGTDLTEILAAAGQGRIETLVVPVNAQSWGAYDADENQIYPAKGPSMSSVDLFESAARLSLNNGGEVFFLEANQIPKRADLMAKFRW